MYKPLRVILYSGFLLATTPCTTSPAEYPAWHERTPVVPVEERCKDGLAGLLLAVSLYQVAQATKVRTPSGRE